MEHVRADPGRGIQVHVLDQHLLAVDHLPVAGQDEIVPDPVEERRDGLTLRQGRDCTSLEAVATVHHESVLRILQSQRVDHRAQRGKPASAFEDGSSLLVEELGGLQRFESAPERLVRQLGDGLEQRERDVLADNGGDL